MIIALIIVILVYNHMKNANKSCFLMSLKVPVHQHSRYKNHRLVNLGDRSILMSPSQYRDYKRFQVIPEDSPYSLNNGEW